MPDRPSRWLEWARAIQALAQTGQHFAADDFARQRAERLLEIASEIAASHSDLTETEVRLAFGAQGGYITPKVDVRGAVFEGEALLMVQERIDGGWTLPGGWADVGESPRTAVEREVWEETGIRVRAARLVGVYDANRVESAMSLFHAYKLVFLCDPVGGEPRPSLETSGVAFFPQEALPAPLSPERTTARHLADVWQAHRVSIWQAAFD